MQELTVEAALRFWGKVQVATPDACWHWQGARDRHGYGQLWVQGRPRYAHQVSLALDGRVLQPGQVTRHLCHTPSCVNPWHLTPGTQQQNNQDRARAGRAKGPRNPRAKLSPDAVREIRQAPQTYGILTHLARLHGVHVTTIRAIRQGKTWKP